MYLKENIPNDINKEKNEHLKHKYALSKQFWSLQNNGLTPEIQW